MTARSKVLVSQSYQN